MHTAMREIGIEVPNPTTLIRDNTGSIAITKNKCNHNRVKHIKMQHHFIQNKVEEGRIKISYMPSSKNLTDLFTKPLP